MPRAERPGSVTEGPVVRLWTVQTAAVWEQVRDSGEAWVDRRRIPGGWANPQYDWLAWQMRSRLSDSQGGLPWFAYCDRPDLRWVRHSRPAHSNEVLIEFAPPAGSFLSFPSWAWHVIFCGQYLALSGADQRAWNRRERQALWWNFWAHEGPLPEPLQAELEASWLRLFRPDLPPWSWRRGPRGIKREAVVEVLRADWVRRATPFVGTGTWGKPRTRRKS